MNDAAMTEAQRQYGVWFPNVKTRSIEGVDVGIKEMSWDEIDRCAKEIGKGVQLAFALKDMKDKMAGLTVAQVLNMGAGAIIGQLVGSIPDHIRIVAEIGTDVDPEIIKKAKGKVALLLFEAVIKENKELRETFFGMLERFGIAIKVGDRSLGGGEEKSEAAGSQAALPVSSSTESQKPASEG